MIAFLEAHRAGLLGRAHWLRNVVAGAVVGVVALPLAMAFAIASGAKPQQGLYTGAKFWIALALTAPVVAIAMLSHLFDRGVPLWQLVGCGVASCCCRRPLRCGQLSTGLPGRDTRPPRHGGRVLRGRECNQRCRPPLRSSHTVKWFANAFDHLL